MGTIFVFQIEDEFSESELERICNDAMEILHDADQVFSLYKPESEISRLKAGVLDWRGASGVQKSIREQAENWKLETAAFFDPISPEGIYDPSGLVKSWAARNASQFLEANGITSFTLNAGGDIYLSSNLKSALLFRVGLANLTSIGSETAGSNMVLDLAKSDYRAVATSGSAERGEHIWKSPDSEFIQATVVAKDLVLADIWATALISGGQEALKLFTQQVPATTACALVTSRDMSMQATAGFASVLATI